MLSSKSCVTEKITVTLGRVKMCIVAITLVGMIDLEDSTVEVWFQSGDVDHCKQQATPNCASNSRT